MKYVLLLVLSVAFLSACSTKQTEAERVQELSELTSDDEFMTLFLDFIKSNHLEQAVVQYEQELIAKGALPGTDEKSYRKYFLNLAGSRCISKETRQALFARHFTNTDAFHQYAKQADKGAKPETKEFKFASYIVHAAGPDLPHSLQYAITNNKLTADKRIFYLIHAAPFKECN